MNWVKIEPGCEMPHENEGVVGRFDNPYGWHWEKLAYNDGQFVDDFLTIQKPTHWMRVEALGEGE